MQGFPLTGLQQFTAVTDICSRTRKVQPYLLNLRGGGQGRGRKAHSEIRSQTKAWNQCPRDPHTTFPHGGAVLPGSAGGSGAQGRAPVGSAPIPPAGLFPFSAISWHSGNQELLLSPISYSELKVLSVSEEEEYVEQLLTLWGRKRGSRAAKTPQARGQESHSHPQIIS